MKGQRSVARTRCPKATGTRGSARNIISLSQLANHSLSSLHNSDCASLRARGEYCELSAMSSAPPLELRWLRFPTSTTRSEKAVQAGRRAGLVPFEGEGAKLAEADGEETDGLNDQADTSEVIDLHRGALEELVLESVPAWGEERRRGRRAHVR